MSTGSISKQKKFLKALNGFLTQLHVDSLDNAIFDRFEKAVNTYICSGSGKTVTEIEMSIEQHAAFMKYYSEKLNEDEQHAVKMSEEMQRNANELERQNNPRHLGRYYVCLCKKINDESNEWRLCPCSIEHFENSDVKCMKIIYYN